MLPPWWAGGFELMRPTTGWGATPMEPKKGASGMWMSGVKVATPASVSMEVSLR